MLSRQVTRDLGDGRARLEASNDVNQWRANDADRTANVLALALESSKCRLSVAADAAAVPLRDGSVHVCGQLAVVRRGVHAVDHREDRLALPHRTVDESNRVRHVATEPHWG